MKKLLLISALLLASGCSVTLTGGLSADAYYPQFRTKDGGSAGDPHKSRHEVTRPTVGMGQNNGNKTDDALRKFFGTD